MGQGAKSAAACVDMSVFDTGSAPADDQFELWRESIGVLFDIEARPDTHRNGYRARLDSGMAGETMITRVRAGEQAFSRSELRSYRDGIEGIMFQVFTGGNVRRRDEAAPMARPGALIGFDLTRDMETVNSAFDLVSIIFPRHVIESRLGPEVDLHLRTIGPDSALSSLTADFIVGLHRSLAGMDVAEAAVAAEAAADLIAECYRGQTRRSDTSESHRTALVMQGREFIRRQISAGEPVDVAIVARALDCSRATLYRAFSSVGGVAGLIRAERLRACLADIAAIVRSGAPTTLGELAMRRGFESDAQFSRAFKAAFGVTPSEAKRALMADLPLGQAVSEGEADRRYEIWLRTLGASPPRS